MSSIASWIPWDQATWRLMVLLWKRAMFTASRNASKMMDATDVRPSDLGGLAAAGLIIPSRDGERIDVRADDQWWAQGLRSVALSLSAEGLHWATHNVLNATLFAIAETGKGRRGAELKAVAALSGATNDTFAWLAGRSLVSIHDADGTDVTEHLTPGPIGNENNTWRAKLTPQGKRIVEV